MGDAKCGDPPVANVKHPVSLFLIISNDWKLRLAEFPTIGNLRWKIPVAGKSGRRFASMIAGEFSVIICGFALLPSSTFVYALREVLQFIQDRGPAS
jgi:hypothetical protein